MQALWWYEGINGKLAQGNTAHIFERPKIIQLGKFGAGYSKHFHQQAFLILPQTRTKGYESVVFCPVGLCPVM